MREKIPNYPNWSYQAFVFVVEYLLTIVGAIFVAVLFPIYICIIAIFLMRKNNHWHAVILLILGICMTGILMAFKMFSIGGILVTIAGIWLLFSKDHKPI